MFGFESRSGDSTRNTGQPLGRDSHVSLRAFSGLGWANQPASGRGAMALLVHTDPWGRAVASAAALAFAEEDKNYENNWCVP